jgi:hypothetical protein
MSDTLKVIISILLMLCAGFLMALGIDSSFRSLPRFPEDLVFWLILAALVCSSIVLILSASSFALRYRLLLPALSLLLLVVVPAYETVREVSPSGKLYLSLKNELAKPALFKNSANRDSICFMSKLKTCGNDPARYLYDDSIRTIIRQQLTSAGYKYVLEDWENYPAAGRYQVWIEAETNFLFPDEAHVTESFELNTDHTEHSFTTSL